MGRFDIFPIFIATFASRRVTLIATHSKSQKQTRLPIRYLYFILPFKLLINKEVIKVFQNYNKILEFPVWRNTGNKQGPQVFIQKHGDLVLHSSSEFRYCNCRGNCRIQRFRTGVIPWIRWYIKPVGDKFGNSVGNAVRLIADDNHGR